MNDIETASLLVVDDEQSIRRLCMEVGSSLGLRCTEAETGIQALQSIEQLSPDIAILDRHLPDMSGEELLRRLKAIAPRTEVAVITGDSSITSAVEAMRLGAYDYVPKPFSAAQLRLVLQRMREKIRLVEENEYLREVVASDRELKIIEGTSSKIQDVVRMISRLKDTCTPVLITGESGTGKELVARAIHFNGMLRKRPFMAVDCGSLVPTLIETELFGFEKGAFTGAGKSKAGLFQAAHGGTIFLDEIGELPLELQTKLLRVLQEKEVRPVGGSRSIRVSVRVIAASNRNLEAEYMAGSFRKDLYFRLNVVSVHLPPLRERKSDIPLLVRSFLARQPGGEDVEITPAAMDLLFQYEWPGNVRELENAVERALALGAGKTIQAQDLPPELRQMAPRQVFPVGNGWKPAPSDLGEIERATIERVFEEVGGDKRMAGKLLGISRATLYRKLKRYQIGTRAFRPEQGASA